MGLGYLLGGGVGTEPHGVELYEAHPAAQAAYAEIAEWTGWSVEQILRAELPEAQEERQSLGTVREAALALGVHDVLAGMGVRPSAVGGLSLGALTAASIAGAVERRDLVRMLAHGRTFPDPAPGDPAQALALAFVPADEDVADYHRGEGVHLAGLFGRTVDGGTTITMLGGLAEDLAALAAERGPERVIVLPGRTIAVHTPLRAGFAAHLAEHITGMAFHPPRVDLYSCLAPERLTTADQVRDLFLRNPTDRISLAAVYEEMAADGVTLGVVVGPSIPQGILAFPFPVVHIEKPDDIERVLTSLYELGVVP